MAKKISKKYLDAVKKVDLVKAYTMAEAFDVLPKTAWAKFDETVDVAFKLGVDPKHADQMIRGAIVLPHGIGKSVKVLVITSGEQLTTAEKAGADIVGGEEIITKIAAGWMEFDKVIATPDMMGKIGRIGRLLGPRGLMPNPKLGTVTNDVAKAVQEQKSGKIEYKTEKNGIVHSSIGKVSFGGGKLLDNFKHLLTTIIRSKPASAKGTYLKSITVSTTMGPGIKIDVSHAQNILTAAS